jgi:hypothetical protein
MRTKAGTQKRMSDFMRKGAFRFASNLAYGVGAGVPKRHLFQRALGATAGGAAVDAGATANASASRLRFARMAGFNVLGNYFANKADKHTTSMQDLRAKGVSNLKAAVESTRERFAARQRPSSGSQYGTQPGIALSQKISDARSGGQGRPHIGSAGEDPRQRGTAAGYSAYAPSSQQQLPPYNRYYNVADWSPSYAARYYAAVSAYLQRSTPYRPLS